MTIIPLILFIAGLALIITMAIALKVKSKKRPTKDEEL
jgi:hypothetical protein